MNFRCPNCQGEDIIYIPRPFECQGGVFYCMGCKNNKAIMKECVNPNSSCRNCSVLKEEVNQK